MNNHQIDLPRMTHFNQSDIYERKGELPKKRVQIWS